MMLSNETQSSPLTSGLSLNHNKRNLKSFFLLENKKKKKGLLRPELNEFARDIRGVQVQKNPLIKLGTNTSRTKHKKGKKCHRI